MTDLVIRTDRPAHDVRPRVDARGTAMLVMNEALARSRQQKAEEAARDHRLARRLSAGRRWDRLAAYAAGRAARARAASG
ncbi:hypothetical protein GCM10010472_14100 [Pseudonocardia halophobica]|uniref:Uncharacterized protein n=1 Tax=Pseudonocardia halophobica TaxID=29401 RepID=A0A9W6L452_9PSEU|nr:hypothetical protein [Pseudonocardia halophobica]GLL12878.1 hypothetical protein GCM10017577_40200 [Pseudonocardia halophobica]